MNGLYIHIPFCKKRCIYCDFYSTTYGSAFRKRYVDCLCKELELRVDYLPSRELHTIYIGGGTPSQLDLEELRQIFNAIYRFYRVDEDAEITFEANPDDLSDSDYALGLSRLPVNRVSMGVQTFHDGLLSLLNRRHTSQQAVRAVEKLHEAGFSRISVDLIYGLPGQTMAQFESDVRCALGLGVNHLSAYALIYEEGTRLWELREERKVEEADEDTSLQMFELLMNILSDAGWEHYEISNFSLPGCRAIHNSGYWGDMFYLGVGPSAHSFNGSSRCWNHSDLKSYLEVGGDTHGNQLFETEQLSESALYDELILKSLRTIDGLALDRLEARFGRARRLAFEQLAARYVAAGQLVYEGNKKIRLTRKGIFVSDGIMSDLMDG